jgi:hypothetical protein
LVYARNVKALRAVASRIDRFVVEAHLIPRNSRRVRAQEELFAHPASDLPVLREALKDGRNAPLAPPDDIEVWAKALESLRDDPALRSTLGQSGLRDFEARCSW